MGCGSSQQSSTSSNSTATTAPPPEYSQAYSNLLGQAQQTASQPLQQYGGQLVQGFSPDQQSAFNSIDSSQGVQNPYLQQANSYLQQATNPLWSSVQQYSPSNAQQYMPGIVSQPGSQASYTPSTINPSSVQFNPQQFSAGAVSQYESPYTQSVVDSTQAQFNNQNAQQANALSGSQAAAGAFGGDRSAVMQAQLAGQQQLAQAPVIAGLQNQGYSQALGEFNTQQQTGLQSQEAQAAAQQTAQGQGLQAYGLGLQGLTSQQQLALSQYGTGLGEFNTQQQNQLGANEANSWLNSQAGFGEMNLGTEAQNTALTGANAQLQSGSLQQSLGQEQLNVPYEQFLQQQAYPFQTTNWLAGLATGVGSNAGGTSTSTGSGTSQQPGANPFSQLLGLGMTAASFFKEGGQVKNNVIPFRKRDGGGMIPYQEINLSSAVPDVSTSYVPSSTISAGKGAPNVVAGPSAPTMQAQQADPLAQGESALTAANKANGTTTPGGLGNYLFGSTAPALSTTIPGANGLPDYTSTLPGISTPGLLSGIGSGISGAATGALDFLGSLKHGGMVPHRADGGPNDPDDIQPITITPQAASNSSMLGPGGGFTPPPAAPAITPERPDWHNALLSAGLATMAGGSHNALQNIGAGGLRGVQQWNADKAANATLAEKQASQANENNRTTLSMQEAQSRAAQLADDMDQRRVTEINRQSNTDRAFYQTEKNQAQERQLEGQRNATAMRVAQMGRVTDFDKKMDVAKGLNMSPADQAAYAGSPYAFIKQGAMGKYEVAFINPTTGQPSGGAAAQPGQPGQQGQQPSQYLPAKVRPVGTNRPADEIPQYNSGVSPLAPEYQRQSMNDAAKNSSGEMKALDTAAQGASQNRADLGTLRTMLESPGFTTNKLAPIRATTSAYINAVAGPQLAQAITGIDPAKADVFNKDATRMGLTFARQTEGAREAVQAIQIALGANPQMGNTLEGNKQIVDLLDAPAKRTLDEQQYAQEWLNKNHSYVGFQPWWNQNHPVQEYTSKVVPYHLPLGANGKVDARSLQPNVTYQTNRGKAYWDGDKFVAAGP